MDKINSHYEAARSAHLSAFREKRITKKQFNYLMSRVVSVFTNLEERGDIYEKEKQMWLPAFDLGCSTRYLDELNCAWVETQTRLERIILGNRRRKSNFTTADYNRCLNKILSWG